MHIHWWTLTLQTINVLILIWLLTRFFFRPVADIIAKRRQEANKLLTDAEAEREAAHELHSSVQKAQTDIAEKREALIAEAQKAAQAERARLLEALSQDIAKRRSEAEAALARDRAAADEALLSHASELAVEIAERLVTRVSPEIMLEAFLAPICEELRALPPEALDSNVEIITATPLSTDEKARVSAALNAARGREETLRFTSDPALLAGMELHGHNTIIRNSWRSDLNRIREELTHG